MVHCRASCRNAALVASNLRMLWAACEGICECSELAKLAKAGKAVGGASFNCILNILVVVAYPQKVCLFLLFVCLRDK